MIPAMTTPMTASQKLTPRQRLRQRLTSGPMIAAPGIYGAFGARIVEQAGFECAYMTGNGVSASLLGRPDVGLLDLGLFAAHAHRAAACIGIPLICDADTTGDFARRTRGQDRSCGGGAARCGFHHHRAHRCGGGAEHG